MNNMMFAARTTATIDNTNNGDDDNDDNDDDNRDRRWPPVPFINQPITVHQSTHHRPHDLQPSGDVVGHAGDGVVVVICSGNRFRQNVSHPQHPSGRYSVVSSSSAALCWVLVCVLGGVGVTIGGGGGGGHYDQLRCAASHAEQPVVTVNIRPDPPVCQPHHHPALHSATVTRSVRDTATSPTRLSHPALSTAATSDTRLPTRVPPPTLPPTLSIPSNSHTGTPSSCSPPTKPLDGDVKCFRHTRQIRHDTAVALLGW